MRHHGIDIVDNPSLLTLAGLAGVTSSSYPLLIENNGALAEIGGTWALTSIAAGGLRIHDSAALTNLDAFASLTSLYGWAGEETLGLIGNAALTDISALSNLVSAAGDVIITGNLSLCPSSIEAVLATCICPDPVVSGNASGC